MKSEFVFRSMEHMISGEHLSLFVQNAMNFALNRRAEGFQMLSVDGPFIKDLGEDKQEMMFIVKTKELNNE